MDVENLAAARHALGIREGILEKNHDGLIGSWQVGELQSPECVLDLPDWARLKEIEGVVWTALPAKFGKAVRKPAADEVVEYLKGLSGEQRHLAEEYVRKAPRQIATPYRHQIEAALGWKAD
ncbi:hypothetical protein [Burkholderia sp. Bp8963]|uniref:hypothetical protein n=1 Tax=Burkholderia sp. Bp8963 TaxID=2184547 RepID=UPI000F59FC96|nr:hypothetical protein [Burkholderia sp. Bp8963]